MNIKWILVLITMTLAPEVYGTEMVGASSAGMGGTGRAAVESIESLYLNPAAIALVENMHFGASYQSGFIGDGIRRNTYSLNLTDGSQGVVFPGSLGYRSHKITDRGEDYNEQEIRGGFGYRANKRLSFGLAYTYLDGSEPNGEDHQQHNVDFGVLFGIMPNWGLSLTGENLVEGKDDIPEPLRRPSRWALGTQAIIKTIMLVRYEALSPLYSKETENYLGHRFGMGFLLKSNFMLNFGYSVDDLAGQNWASAGLVWKGPRLKLAYSFQNEARSELGNRHLIDLWLDL